MKASTPSWRASITPSAPNVENLTLTGTSGINGTGNALDNIITGNTGSNVLTGGGGNDTIDGGGGSDTAVYTGTALAATFGLSGSNLTVTTALDGTDTLTSIEVLRFGAATNNYNLFYVETRILAGWHDQRRSQRILIGGDGNERSMRPATTS